MPKPGRDRVFLSYAHEDLDTVRRIYTGLKECKINIWFDKVDIGPGRWKPAITKAINRCRFFIICLSQAALKKTGDEPGFQDDELNTAYNIAQEQPDKEFTIVPVRLEKCGRGDFRLSGFQQYDLFDDFASGLDNLAVALGGTSLADTTAQDERTEEEKIIEAIEGRVLAAFYADDFGKASNLCDSILAIKPDDANAWHNKSGALANLGRYEEALTACDKALEIEPDYADTWIGKGAALGNLGRNEEALAAYDEALEIEPDNAKAWIGKGAALGNLGRNEEALVAYDEALEIEPDNAYAWNNKGAALGNLGRNEEALAAYDEALEIEPDAINAWHNKGATLADLARYEEALSACNKALEIKPDYEYIMQLKMTLLKRLNSSN